MSGEVDRGGDGAYCTCSYVCCGSHLFSIDLVQTESHEKCHISICM